MFYHVVMNYDLIRQLINLAEQFELQHVQHGYANDLDGFIQWGGHRFAAPMPEPNWEGKENGRSPESAISTLIVHINRFAKHYSKAAIWGSGFSTQEDFIYLITLKTHGEMTKMELIKRNIQEKPTGMLIIKRLLEKGWIDQHDSNQDKRSKVIAVTEEGLQALEEQMGKIRQATQMVSGDLNHPEKMELIRLLLKLHDYHQMIYEKNISTEKLLDEIVDTLSDH